MGKASSVVHDNTSEWTRREKDRQRGREVKEPERREREMMMRAMYCNTVNATISSIF